jgi:hypothetical protein
MVSNGIISALPRLMYKLYTVRVNMYVWRGGGSQSKNIN